MMIRTLVVDDEPLSRLGIRARLRTYPDFQLIAEASSGIEALEMTLKLSPDAVFLDIEMANSSGLEIAPMLSKAARPALVFLTAHRQYAVEAFEVDAIDYLLKPIDDSRFEICLNRIREFVTVRRNAILSGLRLDSAPHRSPSEASGFIRQIAVTDRRRTRFIAAKEIEWIGAAGDHTEIHTRNATYLLRESLSALLTRLAPNLFCQIHRSTAVNLHKVLEVATLRNQDLVVKLKNGQILRASRTFSQRLKNALLLRS